MLLIPTLPALTPVAGIVTNSSDPLSILKNSVTVRIPTCRLSISGNISQKEVIFRQKLSFALRNRGYFVVDNFQQSDYFLFINFDNDKKKQLIENFVEDLISLEFSLQVVPLSDSHCLFI